MVFLVISEIFRVTEDGLYSPGVKKLELENPKKEKENQISNDYENEIMVVLILFQILF